MRNACEEEEEEDRPRGFFEGRIRRRPVECARKAVSATNAYFNSFYLNLTIAMQTLIQMSLKRKFQTGDHKKSKIRYSL